MSTSSDVSHLSNETFQKSYNRFKAKTSSGETVFYIKHNKKKIIINSKEHQDLATKYQIIDGKVDTSQKLDVTKQKDTDQNIFDIHKILANWDTEKTKLKDIVIDPKNSNKIRNPFTGGTFDKSSKNGAKTYKHFMEIYKKVGNKLVPRDTPNAITYLDPKGSRQVTTIGSKKYKALTSDPTCVLNAYSINKVTTSIVKSAFQGDVQEIKINPSESDLTLHSSNSLKIMNTLFDQLKPFIHNQNFHISIRVNLSIQGTKNNYNNFFEFINFFYTDNNNDNLKQTILNRINQFDNLVLPSDDYTGTLNFFEVSLIKPISSGGCTHDHREKVDPEDRATTLVSYRVAKGSNNCLLAILANCSDRNAKKEAKQGLPKTYFVRYNTMRDYLKIPRNIPIPIDWIEKHKLCEYFRLNIVVDWNGVTKIFGKDYETTVYIKLREGHYYHIKGARPRNYRESTKAHFHNQDLRQNENDELIRGVLQPSSKKIMKDDIDPNSIISVKWVNGDNLVWNFQNKNYSGSTNDLIDFILKKKELFIDQHYWTMGDHHKKTKNDQEIQGDNSWELDKKTKFTPTKKKPLLVHSFDSSTNEFFNILAQRLREKNINHSQFPKLTDKIQRISFSNVICFDITTIFGCEFYDLCQDLKQSLGDVDFSLIENHAIGLDLILKDVFAFFKVHVYDFLTIPNLSHQVWLSMVKFRTNEKIHFLHPEMFRFILGGIKGAWNYPLISKFESQFYKEIMKHEGNSLKVLETLKKIKDTKDYLMILDSFGCYPASMIKFPMPAGEPFWASPTDLLELKNIDEFPMGVFEVGYIPPTNIRIPILTQYDPETKKIIYDLKPGFGIYSSVDINNAIKAGYIIDSVNRGIMWKNTCNTYFSDYMKKIINLKTSQSKLKQRIGKLAMNSLYGYMLFRKNNRKAQYFFKLSHVQKFAETNNITALKVLSENKIMVEGYPKHEPERYDVPIHLGIFILSYSKQIMSNFMRKIKPDLTMATHYYMDTDSIMVRANDIDKLHVIKEFNFDTIGELKNDLKDGECIIWAKMLGPKVYCYAYVTNDGMLKHIVKCPGIKRTFVNENRMMIVDKYFDKLEPIDYENREYRGHLWTGMNFVNGEWFPNGFENLTLE